MAAPGGGLGLRSDELGPGDRLATWPPTTEQSALGAAVALSDAATTAFISGPGDNAGGAVWVYHGVQRDAAATVSTAMTGRRIGLRRGLDLR
jgi:hypothetical protein